jgi:hypothetical protein
MTKAAYMQQRAPYNRPQAMLWADNSGGPVAYPTTVNSIPVSNFENATTNWTSNGTLTSVLGSSQNPLVPPVFGTYVAKVVNTGTTQNNISHSATIPVEVGQTYTYSIYVKDGNTSKQFVSYIEWYNAGGTIIGTAVAGTASTTVNSSIFTRVSVTGTAPTNAVNAKVYTASVGNATSGQFAYYDAALFQEGSSVNDYVNGTLSAKYFYAPNGYEVYDSIAGDNFLIISDHNRKAIDFKTERIEKRQRMINGRMRSYHVADKLTISTSWENLPSRSFATDPAYNPATGTTLAGVQYTVDGGAGGADLLKWYEDHQGPFWVYLSYDNPNNFAIDRYNHLDQYSEVIEMYVSDFSHSVQKRGGRNYDFWNVSVTLEEV